jgi:hypothetical protein
MRTKEAGTAGDENSLEHGGEGSERAGSAKRPAAGA